jgi:TRAP-type mannitol/chloroaromatic compound transport system permease large subunit
MRFADTVGEAFRNVREGVARALLVVVGLAGITAGAAWLDG